MQLNKKGAGIFFTPNPCKEGRKKENIESIEWVYVDIDDIEKFAIKRLQCGMRWWEDVIVYNDNSHLYSDEFIKEHPPTW